jgi:hypothetical protein
MRFFMVLNLAVFAVIASQPLFYALALANVQRSLSAPAYIELRQRINAVMSRRGRALYVLAALLNGQVLFLSVVRSQPLVTVTTAAALVCLLADVYLMTRKSIPVNGLMDAWSTTSYPTDWERYRTMWFDAFAWRQSALLFGFANLLIGAVFSS